MLNLFINFMYYSAKAKSGFTILLLPLNTAPSPTLKMATETSPYKLPVDKFLIFY